MARAGWCAPCAPSHHGRAPAGGSDVNQSPMPCTAARNLPPCRPAAWPPQECRTWPCQIRGLAIIVGGNFFRRTGSPSPFLCCTRSHLLLLVCAALPWQRRHRPVRVRCAASRPSATAFRPPSSASAVSPPCFPPPCGRRKTTPLHPLRTASTSCTQQGHVRTLAPPRLHWQPGPSHVSVPPLPGTDELDPWTWN